jgi:RHS repeat-associated protein
MVALNKTYRKTLTPDRSAKASGRRFYSPEISRWLSRDPIREAGGVNLYAFVRNSPVIWVDGRGDELYGYVQAQNDQILAAMQPGYVQPELPAQPSGTTLGVSGYYIVGGTFSVTVLTCCEGEVLYKCTIRTAGPGVGVGVSLNPVPTPSVSFGPLAIQECPPDFQIHFVWNLGGSFLGSLYGGSITQDLDEWPLEGDLAPVSGYNPDLSLGFNLSIVTETVTRKEVVGCCEPDGP